MNRHHYSLFVHNCRLILLLRQEPDSGVDMNTFRPAEWRWRIPEVCDGKWHHYAVSVEFPQVCEYVFLRMFSVRFLVDWHSRGYFDFCSIDIMCLRFFRSDSTSTVNSSLKASTTRRSSTTGHSTSQSMSTSPNLLSVPAGKVRFRSCLRQY